MSFNFTAMILAAGFGKRMMPLTKSTPKPLIDINGITLLDNSINFVKKLGCNQIVVNSHFHHEKIQTSIYKRKLIEKDNIILIYEKDILDTGGGVKNAIPIFANNNLIVINSDIFWRVENLIDAESLINSYKINLLPNLLLVNKKNAFGLKKDSGDFVLDENKISRFKKGDEIIFYAGLQILNKDIFKQFSEDKFSFNIIWDFFIHQKKLCGHIMQSNLYHVGDIQGLTIAKRLVS